MTTLRFRLSALALAIALSGPFAAPASADDDDGWFWGRGRMGEWFRGEMMDRGPMDGWGHGMMMGPRFSEQRLIALKKELGITAAQTAAWDGYTTAVKNSFDAMRGMHLQMMDATDPATLPERLKLSHDMMTARFESMKATSAATLTLYDALTPDQKKKADELILGVGMM
jgi:LTXXQ motif family protein